MAGMNSTDRINVPAVTPITSLGYALLWLIRARPQSGYGLRMVFDTTPLGNYSSSPGSIYPALKNLQRAGLIDNRREDGRPVFVITGNGDVALEAWLSVPVTADDVGRRMDVLMMRFALLQDDANPARTLAFLESMHGAAMAQADNLEAFLAGEVGGSMPLQAQLAVRYGLETTKTTVRWAAEAHKALKQGEAKT